VQRDYARTEISTKAGSGIPDQVSYLRLPMIDRRDLRHSIDRVASALLRRAR
jgi:hypothetical protein